MESLNLTIDIQNHETIAKSFDRIAVDILSNWCIMINDKPFRFTEIEFYYFHYKIHEDQYTHMHKRKGGEWRFHNHGIDITFDGTNNISDGGILIRGLERPNGVLPDEKFVNGPLRIVQSLFHEMGEVLNGASIIVCRGEKRTNPIFKTIRHLPNKVVYDKYLNKKYRYFIDFERYQNTFSPKNLELIELHKETVLNV